MFKIFIKTLLSSCGYEVRKTQVTNPLDLSNRGFKSIYEVLYVAGRNELIVNAPLRNLRIFGVAGHVVDEKSINPFVKTSKDILKGNFDAQKSALAEFSQAFCPASVEERLGFELKNKQYAKMRPESLILPWHNILPSQAANYLFECEISESKQYSHDCSKEDGSKYFGPMSSTKKELEFLRLKELCEVIRLNGYKKFNGNFENANVEILVKGDSAVYLVRGGQHRVAVAAALGIKKIPVQVSPGLVFRREHICYMPAVIKGYYTVDEAEMIFDRIFDGI